MDTDERGFARPGKWGLYRGESDAAAPRDCPHFPGRDGVRRTLLLFLLVPALLLGSTGVSFLKIPVGPRVVATGEAGVAYIDDASALYYNPAGLANVPTYSALFAHNQGFLDMNQEYLAGVYGSEGLGKFGLALDYWGSGSIQGINIRGETIPGYVFSAADWSLNLGYARSFFDFSVGLGVKLIREQNESLSTSAVALDAGAMYKTPLKGLQAGLSVANIDRSAIGRGRRCRPTRCASSATRSPA